MKIPIEQIRKIGHQIFKSLGLNEKDTALAVDVLLQSELRGISTHGFVRLAEYVPLWEQKRINPKAVFKIEHQTPSTALLDADFGFGLLSGPYAMELAIAKAKKVGTGWVAVKRSHHFGIAGYHAMLALKHNMIGISMTNANPLVAPTFSKEALLGTNPMAIAIPAASHPPFVADFATAPISRGKLDFLHDAGQESQENLIQDKDGNLTTQADILAQGGAIRTLGGTPEMGSHKGYCLSAMVDILSAVLPGANFGPLVVPTLSYLPENDEEENNGIGHFFGAISINAFQPADAFKKRMDKWIESMQKAEPIDGKERVLIPGEPERLHEEKHRKQGFITATPQLVKVLKSLSEKFDLEFGLEFP